MAFDGCHMSTVNTAIVEGHFANSHWNGVQLAGWIPLSTSSETLEQQAADLISMSGHARCCPQHQCRAAAAVLTHESVITDSL